MGSANQKSSLERGYGWQVLPIIFVLLLAPAKGAAAPGPQDSGKPVAGTPGSGTDPLTLFEIMPNFKVVESEAVELDYYRFGYLPNTPRIEGRRTTVNYWLKEGSPMPGALGICRHFADVTRQAGGEVLYDNNRNIITVRINRAGRQTWAEFACDKDRYRVNIIERESACEQENCGGVKADTSNIMKTKHDTVKNSISNVRREAAPPAAPGHNPGDPPPDVLFSIEVDGAATSLAAAVPCADAPARIGTQPGAADPAANRRGFTKGAGPAPDAAARRPGRPKWPNIVLRQGFVDQIRAAKLDLVDTNTWSCQDKDGTLVQGALIRGVPRK